MLNGLRSLLVTLCIITIAACGQAAETAIVQRDILVPDQSVVSDTVTVDQVAAPEDAWIVIYNAENGAPDQILGKTLIEAGVQNDIEVSIDSARATSLAFVVLHADTGAIGIWDYPSADPLFAIDGRHFMQPFFLEGVEVGSGALEDQEPAPDEAPPGEDQSPGEYDYDY